MQDTATIAHDAISPASHVTPLKVQSVSGTGGQKMANEKRLIDANALVWSIGIGDDGKQFFYVKAENIDNAPTVDAVEVVRCGECRYCDTADCPMSGSPGRVSASDFCSYGERRTDDG
jgi:hypothetical protein